MGKSCDGPRILHPDHVLELPSHSNAPHQKLPDEAVPQHIKSAPATMAAALNAWAADHNAAGLEEELQAGVIRIVVEFLT